MTCEFALGAGFIAVAVEAARNASGSLMVRGAVHRDGSSLSFGGSDGPADPGEVLEAARQAEGCFVLAWNAEALRLWTRTLRAVGVIEFETEHVLLYSLARRAFPRLSRSASPEDVAAALELPPPDTDQPASVARFLGRSFEALLEVIPSAHKVNITALHAWLRDGDPVVDFSRFTFGRQWLATLPLTPGVYVMRKSDGSVLYVGKASNVRRRVRSYFTPSALESAKNRKLLEQLHSVDVVPAESEIEALLTEMRLIRRYRPLLNIQSDVHDGCEGFGRERNLVLLVPQPEGTKAISYLLKGGSFAGRLQVRLGRPASAALRRRVREVFFSHKQTVSTAQPWERELVFRWLSHRRSKLNFIDVDDAGSCREALRQLSEYLLDPERLAIKVCYR